MNNSIASLLLWVALFGGLTGASHAETKPKSAGVCQFLLSSVIVNSLILVFDPMFVTASVKNRLTDTCRARRNNLCGRDNTVFNEQVEMQAWASNYFTIDRTHLDDISLQQNFNLGEFGTLFFREGQSFSKEEFRSHFSSTIPVRYRSVSTNAFDALLNHENIADWITNLKIRILNHMWNDGIRLKSQYLNPYLVAEYLDLELAQRGRQLGFSVTSSGKPWGLYTFGQIGFSATLAMGRLFADWTGVNLASGNDSSAHGVRGHLLQLVYLAEQTEGIPDLIKYIGRTNDFYGIWNYLFDNSRNTKTPFWTGFWIEAFGDYLNIPY